MTKYQDSTFASIKAARAYMARVKAHHGFTPQVIKITQPVHIGCDVIPAGLIIEYKDVTWDSRKDYVISPLYGLGFWVEIPRHKAIEIEL